MKAQALLLTGVPGIGKTTIIRTVAAALSRRHIRGFVTGELRSAGRRVGFELSTFAGHTQRLAHVDIDSRHRVGRYGVDVAGLDEIAEEALSLDDGADVYLVDEIGKMECFSAKFRSAVRSLFESGRPVVATVALRGGGFIAEIKERPDVELWEATRENRDQMPEQIVRWIAQALPGEVEER
ncbi:MAG: NTPase [Candidatus Latescibacterota bacterium]|nr:MAG: NTPase [Candidatus Latescibacterota bacterium]